MTISRADRAFARELVRVLAITIALRLIILITGLVGFSFTHRPDAGFQPSPEARPWLAWDGYYYLEILEHGYIAPPPGKPVSHVAGFFPLYPLVARTLTPLMSPQAAMVLLSNVCAIIGFAFLYAWLRTIAPRRVALACVLLMCAYPGAVFFSAALTEGPFFMLVAVTVWLLGRRQWLAAAVVAGFASAVRPTGLAVSAVVPLYALVEMRHPTVPQVKRVAMIMLLGLISISGMIIHMSYLWHRYDRPDAFVRAQDVNVEKELNRRQILAASGEQRYSLKFFLSRTVRPSGWNRAMWLPITVLTFLGLIRSRRIPRVLFVLPLLILLLSTLPERGMRINSAFRYQSAAIPIFAMVAFWLAANPDRMRRAMLFSLIAVMFAVQLYYAELFCRGYWVG